MDDCGKMNVQGDECMGDGYMDMDRWMDMAECFFPQDQYQNATKNLAIFYTLIHKYI